MVGCVPNFKFITCFWLLLTIFHSQKTFYSFLNFDIYIFLLVVVGRGDLAIRHALKQNRINGTIVS